MNKHVEIGGFIVFEIDEKLKNVLNHYINEWAWLDDFKLKINKNVLEIKTNNYESFGESNSVTHSVSEMHGSVNQSVGVMVNEGVGHAIGTSESIGIGRTSGVGVTFNYQVNEVLNILLFIEKYGLIKDAALWIRDNYQNETTIVILDSGKLTETFCKSGRVVKKPIKDRSDIRVVGINAHEWKDEEKREIKYKGEKFALNEFFMELAPKDSEIYLTDGTLSDVCTECIHRLNIVTGIGCTPCVPKIKKAAKSRLFFVNTPIFRKLFFI